MSRITIDLVKLIEQATPQVFGSIDPLLLRQWLDRNTGATQPVIVDLAAVSIKNEAETTLPTSPYLRARVNDVTTFGDESELRIHVLAPRGSDEDLATDAYYGLLVAISNI
ncbi:MAG: hypothetical protein HYR94_02130 [Chloroflexi bacterium]|nr:hypothetical protein [Chloroflexota bacterium]